MSENPAPFSRSVRGSEVGVLLWYAIIGGSYSMLAPAIVGGLMDGLSLSARQAGLVSTAWLAGCALGSCWVLFAGGRRRLRAVLLASVAIVALCDLASAAAGRLPTLLLARAGSGIGAGVTLAAVSAAAAQMKRAGVMYAAIPIAQQLFGFVGLLTIPPLLARTGIAGAFVALSGCSVVGLCLMRGVPDWELNTGAEALSLKLSGRSLLILGALFATYLAFTAEWTYVERVGISAGIAHAAVSRALAFGMVGGITGSLGATALLLRSNEANRALLVGAVALVLCTVLLALASVASAFTAAIIAFNGSIALITPLYMARLASGEGGGSRVVLALLAMYLGFISGPVVGGNVVAFGGYGSLGWTAVSLLTLAFVALAIASVGRIREATPAVPGMGR
jgi:predicted MFS family arabinose efflux permease